MGYRRAEFYVVGVDNSPQPAYTEWIGRQLINQLQKGK